MIPLNQIKRPKGLTPLSISEDENQCQECGFISQKELNHWGQCSVCVDKTGENYEKQKAEKETQAHLKRSGIPGFFDPDKDFPAGHPSHELKETLHDGLRLLSGPFGIGKSALAARMVCDTPKAIYVRFIDLLIDVRDTWTKKPTSQMRYEKDVIDKYRKAPLLVIDEIGVQAGSDNERNILYSIVVDRYENGKPTIMTTNLDIEIQKQKEELFACIGGRVADRLRGNIIRCNDWPKLRENK